MFSEACSSFYPASIVEVAFKGRGEFADPQSPAVILEFDERFASLYGYPGKGAAERDCPLTAEKLLARIEKFSDAGDWEKFTRDQQEMMTRIVRDYGFARASVPLRFAAKHPDPRYQEISYLPCVITQLIDGDRDGPHKMYLLVVYIELPKPLGPRDPAAPREESSHA
jgi:hypothetical protein